MASEPLFRIPCIILKPSKRFRYILLSINEMNEEEKKETRRYTHRVIYHSQEHHSKSLFVWYKCYAFKAFNVESADLVNVF